MNDDLISRRKLINNLNKVAMEHHKNNIPMVEHDFREVINNTESESIKIIKKDE